MSDDEALDLVPVHEVMRPPVPTAYLVTALALLILALAMAFAGGSPTYARTPGLSVTINGHEVASAAEVELDLAQPVTVAGTFPPSPPSQVVLKFSALGLKIGSAEGGAQSSPDGAFTASVDAGGARFLVAGEVTGEVELRDAGGAVVATSAFPATSTQPVFLTVPGAAGIALLLFVLAYAGSLLRSRRRGRKAVTATVGMALIGGAGGVCAVVVAWLAVGKQPVVATVVICAVLGAGSGVAAAMAAGRIGQRKRFRGRKPLPAKGA